MGGSVSLMAPLNDQAPFIMSFKSKLTVQLERCVGLEKETPNVERSM